MIASLHNSRMPFRRGWSRHRRGGLRWLLTLIPAAALAAGVLAAPAQAASPALAYVANIGGSTVSVIDTGTNTVAATIPVGNSPAIVALTPSGATAYVTDFADGTVSAVDTATQMAIATIPVGHNPLGMAVSPSGATVYVANTGDGTVSVIDTSTNTVTATITVGNFPNGVAISPSGATAYVTNFGDTTVSVVDTSTNTVTATITVGNAPTEVAVSPSGATAYVTNNADNTVSVIDTSTNTVTATVSDGAGPYGVALSPAAAQAPTVTAISPTSGQLAGGTSVTITGSGFTGATAVSFGAIPASSFTVNSDTSISAIAPSAATVGTVDVTVTTPAGTSAASAADQYSYVYAFTGYQSPVDNPPNLNSVNRGQAIPMKFSLGGNFGLGIIAAGYPTATQISCATGLPLNLGTLTDTSGGSGLQFDSSTGTYTYVWKTSKSWAGTCQQFTLKLADGTSHIANFQFR